MPGSETSLHRPLHGLSNSVANSLSTVKLKWRRMQLIPQLLRRSRDLRPEQIPQLGPAQE